MRNIKGWQLFAATSSAVGTGASFTSLAIHLHDGTNHYALMALGALGAANVLIGIVNLVGYLRRDI